MQLASIRGIRVTAFVCFWQPTPGLSGGGEQVCVIRVFCGHRFGGQVRGGF